MSLEEFAAEIGQGYNICHPCFNGNKFHRKKEFCQSADYVGLDFDNDQEVDELDSQGNQILDTRGKPKKIKVRCDDVDYFSFEDAKRDPFILKYGGIIYLTPSSTPEWNRFRVIFVLPRRLHVGMFKDDGKLTAQKQFEQAFDRIARYFIFKYGSDEACKDCSRFYYGTHQKDRVVIFGGYVPTDVMLQLRKEYEDAHPKVKPQEFKAALDIDVNSADVQERAKLYGERALQQAKQHIEQAQMGTKNPTRARWAYLIGGYVRGNLIEEDRALAELEIAVRNNTDNFSKAWKTIDYCFAEGMNHPIRLEDCEKWRLKFAPVDNRDEEIITPDGEIIDPNDDPPISDDPKLEDYLRKLMAHASRFTRARMMMAVALGFTKLPWRLLNAILAKEYGSLNVRVITNEKMLVLYASNGDRVKSESTLTRDKKKLWKAQAEKGIELVWYMQGFENLEPGQKFGEGQKVGSRYKCNLDRWTLEAIALAIKKKGSYRLKDAEIKAACEEIAKQVPRFQIEDKPEAPEMDSEAEGEKIHKGAEISLERLVPKFQEAWDLLGLTVGHRHIRTRTLLREFGTLLLKGADASTATGKCKRKRTKEEIKATVDTFVSEILEDASPVNAHARVTNSHPFFRTAVKKGSENDTLSAAQNLDLQGVQNDYLVADEESTTYERQLKAWFALGKVSDNDPRAVIWHTKDDDRLATVIGIFDDPGPDGRLYVRTLESAGGLPFDELEFLSAVAATTGDPLVDALLADEMEAYERSNGTRY